MALETFPYDAAEYLTEPRDVFYFLEAELEDEQPSYWPGAIKIVARSRGGMDQLARESRIPLAELEAGVDEKAAGARDLLVRLMEAYRPADEIRPTGSESAHAV